MKKHLILSALAALPAMVISCQQTTEGEETVDGTQKEIRLSTTVSLMDVKASFPQTDTQLAEGSQVRVWVDENDRTAVPLYENNILTANGNGGLYGGETMYYPASGNPVNVYALKTNASIGADPYPDGTLQHTVSTGQTDLEGFASSDLLYAREENVENGTAAVALTFYHLLSKVQVAVALSEGLAKEDIAGVEINGTKILAGFALDKSVSPDAVEINAGGEIQTIVIGHDISETLDSPAYNDAVIVPQTVEEGTPFIVVTLADSSRLAYRLTENKTFSARTAYQYYIQVKRDGLSVTTSVADWLPGGLVEGEAGEVL